MADATAPVAVSYRRYSDDKGRHSFGSAAAAVNLYNNAMLGLNAGYIGKFDDLTASLRFLGIVLENEGNPMVVPISTAGDGTGDVEFIQPTAFELAISNVAITDIGRRVYALDDQTGTLDPSATTYANLIGVVKDLVYSTNPASPVSGYALVAPAYNSPAGNQQQVATASGAIQVKTSYVVLKAASAVLAMTLANPTAAAQDGMEITIIATGTGAHTVTTGASGLNGADHIATFGGAIGDNIVLYAFNGTWLVESSVGIVLS